MTLEKVTFFFGIIITFLPWLLLVAIFAWIIYDRWKNKKYLEATIKMCNAESVLSEWLENNPNGSKKKYLELRNEVILTERNFEKNHSKTKKRAS